MKQVIYVDVLVAVNLFVNYFLLLATAKFFSLSVKRYRILLASALGAVYSLYILLPPLHILFNILVKLVMSVTITMAAFGVRPLRMLWKTTVCFYAMNFAFAGIMAALWYLAAPRGLVLNNGIVYFNISPLLLVIATLICYFLVRFLHWIIGQGAPKELFLDLVIGMGGQSVSLRAKIDTGNSLVEPFSHLPAVVVEYQAVNHLLPQEIKAWFQKELVTARGNPPFPEAVVPNCRMVPFHAVSGKGVLPAFYPDFIEIKGQRKEAYIAVCDTGMFHGEYTALVNPQLIS